MFSKTQSEMIQEVYEEQLQIYENYKPRDAKIFASYPSLIKEMAQIEAMSPNNDKDRLEAVRQLESFNRMWFPDTTIPEQDAIFMKLEKAHYLFWFLKDKKIAA